MKRIIPWSNNEDQRLRELALAGLNLPAIAVELGRSTSGVRWRAEKLLIKIARGTNGMAAAAIVKRIKPRQIASERARRGFAAHGLSQHDRDEGEGEIAVVRPQEIR